MEHTHICKKIKKKRIPTHLKRLTILMDSEIPEAVEVDSDSDSDEWVCDSDSQAGEESTEVTDEELLEMCRDAMLVLSQHNVGLLLSHHMIFLFKKLINFKSFFWLYFIGER